MDIRLLEVHPKEIKFIFEEKKQALCLIQLTNKTINHVAFKVKTTQPQKYFVGPNMGIIEPLSTCEVKFSMKAQSITPSDMKCKDKFLIQSTIVPIETTLEDITSTVLFGKNNSKNIEERKLGTIIIVRPSKSPTVEAVGVSEQSNVKQIEELKLMIDELDLQLHQARVAISKLEKERTIKKTKSLQKNCTIL